MSDKRRHGTDQVGERNGSAKLTWAEVADIRRLKAEGVKLRVLAVQFGVHKANIEAIIYGRTWTGTPPA